MANTKEAVALTGLDIAGGGVTVIIRVSPTNLFTVLIEGKYTVSDLKERIADRGGAIVLFLFVAETNADT